MEGSRGGDRSVRMSVQRKQVTVESGTSLSYPGILLIGFEDEEPVCERWVPFGDEPTEEDDERLIEELRGAMLWQQHRPSSWCGA